MRGRATGHDFVDPMIMKILEESKGAMTTLAINYRVNETIGKTINLKIIKDHLGILVKGKKVSESFNEDNGITYYEPK